MPRATPTPRGTCARESLRSRREFGLDDEPSPPSVSLAALTRALEHSPVTAYLLRAIADDFVLEAVNAAARLQSPNLVTMLGRPVSLLYRDQPQIIDDAKRCMRERTTVIREIAVRRHDRIEANQLHRLVFVFLESEWLVIYAHDLDEHTNAEAALAESAERYRSLVASLPDAVLVRGADGCVLACNEIAVELFGQQSQADLLGKAHILAPGLSVHDGHGAPVAPEKLPSLEVIRSGVPVANALFTLQRADGSKRFIRVSVEPIRTRAGGVGGSVTLYTDETQRITAERAERESAARLQLALDAAHMGSWEWEPSTDVGSWSPQLFQHFQLSAIEPGFEGFLRRMHPDDIEAQRALAATLSQRQAGETFESEFRLIGEDGLTRWARVYGRVEKEGERLRLAGTLMDVTERRRLEEELRRAHRLESIGRLAGGLSHDFNNLLTAMFGSLEFLEEMCPPEAHEDLAAVKHSAERARELTAQLLAFARKQPFVLEIVDVGELITKVERLLKRLVGPAIELVIDGASGFCVRADRAQLEQLLVNLVANARDAMPNGGPLHVRVSSERSAPDGLQEHVVLEVEDSGTGMDAETIGHVFDPFFTTKPSGTGLGLASSYGIVRQHDGDIQVDSEPGRGARFRVFLPRVVATTSAAPARVREQTVSAGSCVLVVDDEDAVRNTTVRLLKSLGYAVLSANGAEQAIELARTHASAIDILLCDVAMPRHSGPEVARDIRGILPNVRVLFVSGYPLGAEGALDTAGFLQKPYTRAALRATLENLKSR